MDLSDFAGPVEQMLVERVEESTEWRSTGRSQTESFTGSQCVFETAVDWGELVLDGRRTIAQSIADGFDVRVVDSRDVDSFGHTFVHKLLERVHLVFVRHLRIIAARVEQVERVGAKATSGFFGIDNHGFGLGIGLPAVVVAAVKHAQPVSFDGREHLFP